MQGRNAKTGHASDNRHHYVQTAMGSAGFDFEALEFLTQRSGIDREELGGFFLVPVGFFEGGDDE